MCKCVFAARVCLDPTAWFLLPLREEITGEKWNGVLDNGPACLPLQQPVFLCLLHSHAGDSLCRAACWGHPRSSPCRPSRCPRGKRASGWASWLEGSIQGKSELACIRTRDAYTRSCAVEIWAGGGRECCEEADPSPRERTERRCSRNAAHMRAVRDQSEVRA